MREAIDRLTGRHKSAENAVDVPHRYLCPECRAPVSLRAGRTKQAYFAHMPGSSGRDCGLYVEGFASATGIAHALHPGSDTLWAMDLRLQLSTSSNKGWGLELSVPTGGQVGVEIQVNVGDGRVQTIRCSSPDEISRTVTADPQEMDYEIACVLPRGTPIASVLERKCPGLNSKGATTFGEIARPNGSFARARELRAGRTYVLIWPSRLAVSLPQSWFGEPLKQRPKWEATLVTLPNPLSSDEANWLTAFTGLHVETDAAEIVPVWPPLTVKATAGFIEAMPKTDVFFYAGRITRTGRLGARALFARSGNQTIAQNSSGASDSFFHLRPEEASVVELTCLDRAPIQLTADFVFKEKLAPLSGPELVATAHDGTLSRIPLYSREANEWLAKVRVKQTASFYLALPPGLKGELLVDGGRGWEKCLSLQGTGGVAGHDGNFRLLPQRDAEELVKALHNRRASVLLDFGAFGFVKSDALLSHCETAEIRLPAWLRQRILVYLCQTRKRPVAALSVRNIKNRDLIGAFLRCGVEYADVATWRTLQCALNACFKPSEIESILGAK